MLTELSYQFRWVLVAAVCVAISCTPGGFIKPNPPPSVVDRTTPSNQTTASSENVIDFGDAFSDDLHQDQHSGKEFGDELAIEPMVSGNVSSIVVPAKTVRVCIVRNKKKETVYTAAKVVLKAGKRFQKSVRGRIQFEAHRGKVRIATGTKKYVVALPCTLTATDEYNFIDIDNATYRGTIIVQLGTKGRIRLVNRLPVEEYLRGVVPLEMGRRSLKELEALKAQAVAARTYTYKRMVERRRGPYDVVNTVADQVYGGASVENREADRAIKETADNILVYGDSIVYAYYHSTCGGKTAAIEQVWNKPAQPYLVSVLDLNDHGEAFCRSSAYFTWVETWQRQSLSSIVHKNIRKMFPAKRYTGPVARVTIDKRLSCGRVERARITGKGWVHFTGGDQIRFIMRRAVKGNPILRSANFTIDNSNHAVVKVSGRGYGHGVGMCQMGALGRARAGQTFDTILKAYYTGTSIAAVKVAGEK